MEFAEDTHVENAGTFTIYLEDHTAGNVIKMYAHPIARMDRDLLNNPDVLFAGYRMPHPLENKIEIKVQTNGKIRPTEAFARSISNVINELDGVGNEFEVFFALLSDSCSVPSRTSRRPSLYNKSSFPFS